MIQVVAETASTNADMLGLATAGWPEGAWLRAERQTAGRGRQGRAWVSEAGNLYASTLVRLRPADPPAPSLALVAGVAVAEVVSLFVKGLMGVDETRGVLLKWPNDLLLDGAKLSGILLERVEDAVVIGIGVNLAHHPDLPERPAASLAARGVEVAPEVFVETLAEAFARWLSRWRGEGLAVIRAAWLARAHAVGAALSVKLPDGVAVQGLFDGLDAEGALALRLATGERRVIHAADVFLL